ncbi:heparinase II/III family protein [Maribacter sp. ANRC-HE7]|uniref:Heparinase II/III family protein n=1 Tax=Maribacter aquimaris TaxID=2737171 RepID=A0ABR7V6I2_9FLAO|nr:heparinase II/III family protein [Maribacter aquimaris]MBD0778911.1 heparinase II/III family protein [Maribacter aquimaris]
MKCYQRLGLLLLFLTLVHSEVKAQVLPDQRVLDIETLADYLKPETRGQLQANGEITTESLAAYFRERFSERFFYDYKGFDGRLETYNTLYGNEAAHKARAMDHFNKYPAVTQWVLPFDYLNGEPVNAYALRHLARQHKMVDLALLYFNEGRDPKYIKYFVNQMKSMNTALESGDYEKIEDGNGIYEAFRSGYRISNWLWIHNMFLSEPAYTDADQLQTVATLLQHGQHLYERNEGFVPGNHQTKGMSGLAVLSILFRDFEGTDKWYDRAMLRLSEHLDKEINPDGFQFERSVHYHMSDINNYFYVYQLAQINKITVAETWEQKLKSLFSTLVKIAYPDKSAPVLQDDTEIPWAEKNDISGAMTLGYVLFNDPEFGYFATDKVDEGMYWFLSNQQVEQLRDIGKNRPSYGSLALEDTHYYIMRQGWEPNDKMMVVSAGLDADKPDHQHGDMLGIQAIANGQVVLPNYQVRYSLEDFELFKNSMVKNVALIDDELQGKQWTSNKGGSGFGKFKELPHPKVIAWESNESFDLFVGSHDGFETKDVAYTRQVVYCKDEFWIVKDNFQSNGAHDYKQIWQGHYTTELAPKILRASFPDAAGCDILQLNGVDTAMTLGARGKNWTVVSKAKKGDFNFLTLIFPYKGYSNRIDETKQQVLLNDWVVNDGKWQLEGSSANVIHKGDEAFLFGIREVKLEQLTIQASQETDLYISLQGNKLEARLLGDSKTTLTFKKGKKRNKNMTTVELVPGEHCFVDLD